jgi:diguanylate cyclase (GGDEF)-like protein
LGILVVDDSKLIRTRVEEMLKNAGYQDVKSADSALEVLKLLDGPSGEDSGIDLVLMDVMLPDLDGIETCRRLKACDKFRDVPVIMVTAKADSNNLKAAFEAGAMDYITKPLKEEETLARVRSALRLKQEMDRRKDREKDLLDLTHKLEDAIETLRKVSILDSLTGISNRRHFDDILDKEWRRALRSNLPLFLYMIDLDHFKPYNDHYGHVRGDEALARVAGAIKGCLKRPGDLAARYGGEEFAVLLPATEELGALRVAEIMRQKVEDLGIEHCQTPAGKVTISLGVAEAILDRKLSPVDMVNHADKALYQAKEQGRNRVVHWKEDKD